MRSTFETNIYGYFFMAQAALPHLKDGAAIISTSSIVGLIGHILLIPCSSSKGAVHAFTKALALNLGKSNIRVNTVIPGPIRTPNIPGLFLSCLPELILEGVLRPRPELPA